MKTLRRHLVTCRISACGGVGLGSYGWTSFPHASYWCWSLRISAGSLLLKCDEDLSAYQKCRLSPHCKPTESAFFFTSVPRDFFAYYSVRHSCLQSHSLVRTEIWLGSRDAQRKVGGVQSVLQRHHICRDLIWYRPWAGVYQRNRQRTRVLTPKLILSSPVLNANTETEFWVK